MPGNSYVLCRLRDYVLNDAQVDSSRLDTGLMSFVGAVTAFESTGAG
jgi:hypothetical protein